MKSLFSIACLTTILSFSAFSTNEQLKTNQSNQEHKTSESIVNAKTSSINLDHQKIIDDFKKYLLTVKPSTREEIKNYRIKMRELNAKKIELYKKLTEEAQNVLKQETEFKKKLPWPERKALIKEMNLDKKADSTDVTTTKTTTPKAVTPAVTNATAPKAIETINMAKPAQTNQTTQTGK